MQDLGKVLIILGIVILGIGCYLFFQDKLPFKLPLGRLPGDINVQRENFSFHFPWVTCLVVSIVISLILGLFKR